MLDVVVTISKDTPAAWVRQCLRSCEIAATTAGYSVRIIQTPGYPGHIGEAMAEGFAKTDASYVAWVDDDDFVLPNAFRCLAPHFSTQPAAICAREVQLFVNGQLIPQDRRHHLTAFRRSTIEQADLVRYPSFPNVALHHAAADNIVDELSWVYVYRRYRSPGSYVRAKAAPAEREILV